MSLGSISARAAIQDIAQRYHCDSNDPIFSILEKMEDYHEEVRFGFQRTIPKEVERLQELILTFQNKSNELNQAAVKLGEAAGTFETHAKVVGESTEGLIRYWKQIHWYHALIGMGVSLVLCSGVFGIFYLKSADRLLSQAGVTLKSEKGNQGRKITLSGRKLIDAGKMGSDVVVEYGL